jgi:hypothetical protein
MLNSDPLQAINLPRQAAKPSDNQSDQKEQGCCNNEKFKESLEKAANAFSSKTNA